MKVFAFLKSLTIPISRVFYRHAKFCATHQVYVIVAAIFIVLPLCYPALNAYYLNPAGAVPAFYWELPSSRVPISRSSFQQKCGTQPSLHVESIVIKTNGSINVLEKDLFLWTLRLQERLAKTVLLYSPNKTSLISRQEPKKYTLSSLCFKPAGESRCLVHSPIEFWNYDADLLDKDDDILKTLSKANKISSFEIPIPLESVFGNPVYDPSTGRISSADSIILTYYLEGDCAEGQTLAVWDLLWKQVMDTNDTSLFGGERIKALDIDFKDTSNHIVFDFNRNKEFPSEFVLLAFEYLVMFLYISLSLGRLNSVKSKFGLAFSTVVQVFVSLIVSLSVCSLFGVTFTFIPWKLLPFVLMLVGVENMFVLTNAVTSTSMELDVEERVGRGLEKVGCSMTKNTLLTGFFLLAICSIISIDSVQEFCIFTSVAMTIDYLLQMSFFITTLSIDLRRLEISDLYNRRVGTPLTPTKTLTNRNNSKGINGMKSRTLVKSSNNISGGKIVICLIILILIASATNVYQENRDLLGILSSLKNIIGGSYMNQNAVENIITPNTFYETSTTVYVEAFWNVVNPKRKNRYFEIRHPRKLTLLRTFGQIDNPTRPVESTESSSFLSRITRVKLSIRSTIKNLVFGLKFIVFPALVIYYATSFLVSCLVSSDQITISNDKDKSSFLDTHRVVTLRGCHSADVSLLCANPNGMIISTATDKHITSWNGIQGVPRRKLERYMRKCDSCKCGITGGMKKCISWPVRAMCMSEKIELAAAGFEDGVVRVWDINSGQATYILKDTVEDVESVMSAMSGNTSKERVTCLQFVVPTSSSSIPQTPAHENRCTIKPILNQQDPAILLATYRDGYFREWDLVSGQVVHTMPTNQKGGISYLCVVDDGELNYNQDDLCIFTGARDGSVKCWVRKIYYSENESNITDTSEPCKSRWKSIYTIPGESGNAITCISTKVVKTANKTYGIVITGAADGAVRVYDYLNGKPITTLSQGTISEHKLKKEKEQLLLQKRLLIQQQKLTRQQIEAHKNNLFNSNLSSDTDWDDDDDDDDDDADDDDVVDFDFDYYEDDETEDKDNEEDELSHQDSITNIIINLLEQESCPCGNSEYGGFSIVTSSVDEKVHVWQLVRNVMDCTCITLRMEKNSNDYRNNDVPIERHQQKDVVEWDGVVSYQSKFIGRVNQPGGTAIVLIKEYMVGVRKVKDSITSKYGVPRCHGAEGEWELWMLDVNDPKVTQDQENSDNEADMVELLVQTIPLVNELDLFAEEQQKKKKEVLKRRDKESTGELKGFVRRRRNNNSLHNNNNVVGSNFGPIFPISLPSSMRNHDHDDHDHNRHRHHDHHDDDHEEDTQGQVVDYRQRSQRRRGSVLQRVYPNGEKQLSLLEEEDEMNEILPFVNVRQLVKIGDYGVAVAYGNFVKVVLFEELDDYDFNDL